MPEELRNWPRPYYQPGGGDAYLCYVIFGELEELRLTAEYRCAGVPEGLNLARFQASEHPEYVQGFRSGYAEQWLREQRSELLPAVQAAAGCTLLSGTVADPGTLDYLRDAVGLVQALLDQGGIALLDPQTFEWWDAHHWRQEIFDAEDRELSRHVTLMLSEDPLAPGRNWWHSRGLRKFGRPDLSVRLAPPEARPQVEELLNRFIGGQIRGYSIPEGQPIRMPGLPEGMVCRHAGHLEDPDFNNVHVEMVWPE